MFLGVEHFPITNFTPFSSIVVEYLTYNTNVMYSKSIKTFSVYLIKKTIYYTPHLILHTRKLSIILILHNRNSIKERLDIAYKRILYYTANVLMQNTVNINTLQRFYQ